MAVIKMIIATLATLFFLANAMELLGRVMEHVETDAPLPSLVGNIIGIVIPATVIYFCLRKSRE